MERKVKVRSRYRITIPKMIREHLDLRAGDVIEFSKDGHIKMSKFK